MRRVAHMNHGASIHDAMAVRMRAISPIRTGKVSRSCAVACKDPTCRLSDGIGSGSIALPDDAGGVTLGS